MVFWVRVCVSQLSKDRPKGARRKKKRKKNNNMLVNVCHMHLQEQGSETQT